MSKKLAIGIDLGTTYSCVSIFRNGRVEVIPNDRGNRTTPTCVAFTDTEWLVGEAALSQASINPVNTILNVKRFISRGIANCITISKCQAQAFEIICDKNDRAMIRVIYKGEVKEIYIEQILAMILTQLKQYAEAYLGHVVTEAVISVPTGFTFFQKDAIKAAAVIASLNVLRLILEPTAVALAYNFENTIREERTLLSFDCGGGFTNVSILAIEDGILDYRSVACNTHLGGENFVDCLLLHFVNEFKSKYKKDLSVNYRSVCRLRKACEEAKKALSFQVEACIEIDSLFEGVSFCTKITRTKFEEICADLFQTILEPVQKAIKDSKLSANDIEEVIVVGGSTRIPKIQKLLQNYFGDKKLNKSMNPDEAVACGGAVQAAILSGISHPSIEDCLILPILGSSIGIEAAGGVTNVILKRNATIPKKESWSYTLQNIDGVIYLEPLYENKELYKMESDTDIVVPIFILEGERAKVADNIVIDRFDFIVTRSKSPREIELDITIDVDRNRYVCINITEKGSSASEMRRSVGQHKFSGEEIESMLEDSEKFTRDFVAQRATIAARDDLEKYAFSVKSQVEDVEQYIKIGQRASAKCLEVIDWLDSAVHLDKQEIGRYQNELEEICRPVLAILHPNSSSKDQEPQQNITTKSISDVESAIKETEAKLKEMETKFVTASQREVELTTQITTLESSASQLKYSLKLLESKNTVLKSENTELKSEITELQSSKKTLTGRLETTEAHARDVAGRLAQAEAHAQELEAKLTQELQPFWVVTRSEIRMTEEEIGRGGWGAIKVAEFRGQRVAAKMLHNEIISPNNIRLFSREMTMFSRVHHPNIVQFLGATREGTPIILLELMNTSLRSELGKSQLPRNLVLSIMSDIARALNYLHLFQPRPIIHRDVSSANVLLDPAVPPIIWKAKLSDFGSTNFVSTQATAGPGSPLYAAPEAFNPYQQTPKMDVFSFGAVLIEACTREMPSVEDRGELIGQIAWVQVVPLIRRCMQVNQDDRPSMEGVLTELAQLQRTV